MAAENDYVWMNQSEMMMPQVTGVSPDLLSQDQSQAGMDTSFYSMSIPNPYESVGEQPMQLDGFIMMEELEGPYYGEPPRYMSATTQTANSRKKIRPVNHPGLKLQTPIAYKCDTDPSVIPIQKDGMAICEKCGAIGVKHAFYTRHRKFCSLSCARGSLLSGEGKGIENDDSLNSQENSNNSSNSPSVFGAFPNGTTVDENEVLTNDIAPLQMSQDDLPSFNVGPGMGVFTFPGLSVPDDPVSPVQSVKLKQELAHSYDWNNKLKDPNLVAVSVNCFKHAPMADCWDDITIGIKVEVENSEDEGDDEFPDSFWVATVLRIAGYKALLRYEGFTDSRRDFWVNLCCSSVHPVGWCATRGKPLIPPNSIEETQKDWKEFLVRRLTGARTLPNNFYSKVHDSLKSRFRVGLNVEVIDKDRISQVCVARVKKIVGKRLNVSYYDAEDNDPGFWCHEDSPLLHPVGWASRVGHEISAPQDYIDRCESGLIDKDDATEELFTAPFQSSTDSSAANGFKKSMKLEAIDPLNLSVLCVATVKKVLRDGYLMICIDKYATEAEGSNWFCYHAASPYIFPPGFCHKHSITLVPPINYTPETFTWDQFKKDSKCCLAPDELFDREMPDHGFKPGMLLESADVMDPRLVCVATISRVVGRLLKVHFEGWEDDYDQWLDCRSPDIYPVGWCSLVSHKLEAPFNPQKVPVEKKKSGRPKKGKRKIKGNLHLKKNTVGNPSSAAIGDACSSAENERESMDHSADTIASESITSVGSVNSNSDATSPPESAVPSSSGTTMPFIPRIIDGPAWYDRDLNPTSWTTEHVAHFLKLNDCGVHADKFTEAGIDGKSLLVLSQDQIMGFTGFKIGPTLKIFDIIQQLKIKTAKANLKKVH